ncbi:MAG: Eco57I restriction-modification methylase domain-containing protein [Deltaproteobacteria bacterium]|nr:Eco57I restriction-modification methylase domain-containing protein [Deltaproteobacteria bacterium]
MLPVGDEHRYYRKSLRKLQLDVLDDLHRVSLDHMSRNAYDYWARLESLCRIIDKGDKALNVPTYNGGLFQSSAPDEDQSPEARAIRFIRDHKLADPFLAEAIEALTADDDPAEPGQHSFIDYSSLGVRHLGDIYEGLLEFHVRVAPVEMAEGREKGRAVWKPLSEVKNARHRRKHPGEIYIENSRHERRATGSYFTPHYIVEYIVKHAVGPVLKECLAKVETLLEEYETLQKKVQRQKVPGTAQIVRTELLDKEKEIFDTLFSLKVLDPAMGSGHFLVHTVDFIADRIIAFLAEYPDNPVVRRVEEMRAQILEDVRDRQGVEIDEAKLTEVNLIKRMVMKRCIYGVDLNPMAVELAKLSLWLDSFTLGAPLSFLDHHLKCGNSLIGARDMQAYLPPGSVRRSEFLQAMGNLLQVAEITDATASEVEQSRQLYREAIKWLHPTKERVNVQTAKHFIPLGNEGKVIEWAYRTERKTDDLLEKPHLENFLATQTVAAEKRFFHWELEFPEVFFERHGAKENPGFDAVVGNPPYENAWKMTDVDGAVRAIIAKCSQHPETLVGHWDLYVPFISRALWLLQKGGLHSFIVPDALAREKYAMPLRRLLVAHTSLVRWMHFEGENVFDEVSRHCVIYILRKEQPPEGSQLTVDPPLSVGESRESSYRIVQSDFLVGPAQQFRLGEDAGVAADLLKRIENQSVRLGQYCYVMIGATTHSKDRTSFRKADILTSFPKGNAKPFFDGKNLRRYEIVRDGRYLDYRRDEMYGPRVPELFESPKVVVRNVTDENERLVVAFDKDGLYCDDLVNCVTLYENVEGAEVQTNFDGYLRLSVHLPSLQYTLAIVASSLMSWYFRSVFATGTLQGSYSHTYPQQVRAFPIRRLSFTTREKERAQLMEKGKKTLRALSGQRRSGVCARIS